MKQFLFFIVISILFISCKKQPVTIISQKDKIETKIDLNSIKKLSCENVFLELIKSSDFPFKKNINNQKLSIIIDEFDQNKIIGKLIFKTDGTGTLGWINLNLKNGKLYNESAHLKNPVQLSYNKDIFNILLKNCNIIPTKKDDKNADRKKYKVNNLPVGNEYEDDYMQIKLPISWANIKTELYFDENFMALLPKINNFQPIILTGVQPIGSIEEFLIILDKNNKEISKIQLSREGSPDGNQENYISLSFKIDKNYNIIITTDEIKENLDNNKIIIIKSSDIYYVIDDKGQIVKK